MYIPRPYESKVVGRQLAHSPGNGLFSWNLLRTPWQLTDRRGSQDVLCWEECVAQAHSPLQHHRHSDDCSVLNRQNQVCWTAVEACGRLQTVIPSSAYSMANFCVKFRVLITTHSFSSEHQLSHAHLCCLSSWTKKRQIKIFAMSIYWTGMTENEKSHFIPSQSFRIFYHYCLSNTLLFLECLDFIVFLFYGGRFFAGCTTFLQC